MNFLSYCPLIYKINTIKTLLHRAYKLSSNYLNFTQEVEYLRNLFYNNSYPSDFFERQVYKFFYKIRQSPAELITVERKQIFLSFPYFGPSSFELSKKLTKILSHIVTLKSNLSHEILMTSNKDVYPTNNYSQPFTESEI